MQNEISNTGGMNRLINRTTAPIKIWRACLYLRLSKDDRDKSESNSIKNQRDMLLDFVRQNLDIEV